MWVKENQSGMNKRQCTVQITLFANGTPRVKPMLIFCGTGKRIKLAERVFNHHVFISSNLFNNRLSMIAVSLLHFKQMLGQMKRL